MVFKSRLKALAKEVNEGGFELDELTSSIIIDIEWEF